MLTRLVFALVAACAACAAAAQSLYWWTDEAGRVHVTDMLPPAGAKNVRRIKPVAGGAPSDPAALVPYVLDLAMKEFPVTLYTSPACAEPCASARDLLNKL